MHIFPFCPSRIEAAGDERVTSRPRERGKKESSWSRQRVEKFDPIFLPSHIQPRQECGWGHLTLIWEAGCPRDAAGITKRSLYLLPDVESFLPTGGGGGGCY
ncbi:hypothetical protein E2C01_000875 [Portunus trituberculatus]|uniref:Uncharacterized protein n=1 Tax=Portunus trituberculatus TaxID=210409 RepID=A0A5B7CG71_PORTR|nr:hypothetical protein [Portunus trituberculatus]